MRKYNYIIIGAGIIGLTIARELKKREPEVSICILEKESDVAAHASGRNSGVLHAGFYYSANSLKAKFTKEGNQAMRAYCKLNGLQLNECGKLVVAKDETELAGLEELKLRADINGVQLIWMNEQEIASIDPNAKTYRKALYSPTTASVDPVEVCRTLKRENVENGVEFHFLTKYRKHRGDLLFTSSGTFKFNYLINCAGLYADSIAHDFGFGGKYTIIPFKGIYLKYTKNKTDVVTNIYPVPNLKNPFLGVHYTKTVDGSIKIGPTAMPAFWRENYQGLQGFNLKEFLQIVGFELKLFITNSFHFRRLAFQEMRKYIKSYFIGLGMGMVREIDPKGFGHFLKPGIRAQLLNVETLELVQDFVIEGDKRSMHVLNAVSPAFTCSMPFAAYVVDHIMKQRGGALS
ncbi:L-2-hydroxyglutarate oxidase [Paenibacillus sp. CGMCC 1.16610]|uniref:L-2-hydroxyglutarate oxidase n=1 Tax=Paenibacillus anseongense TaxID=2682845 RepID=A0ABW9UHB4_9BACL|nr:L-2-hydroxyglutarate oxidase [Paenibacillus sp. CGMCC 1.16610]MBA2938469.1 L-2-hydroxyglutarate oxidase [Paenibacillus sp. CGMCC 1.16610]MVQ39587.1 L-2-hydroxyglutarate oxidase [Paenibacillus anseongense]